MNDSITLDQRLRSEQVSGIGCFWVFAANHKDLPLGSANPFAVCVDLLACDLPEGADIDAANRAEVDRIAAILGTEAHHPGGNPEHWAATRDFGGGVTYTATAITRKRMGEVSRQWAAMTQRADENGAAA